MAGIQEIIKENMNQYEKYITEMPLDGATVWILSLRDIPENSFYAMYTCCDAKRKEKIDAIKADLRRRQSIGAGYLLCLLKQKFSVDSEIVALPDGKLVFEKEKGLWFNISHSGEWAAIAYGKRPLGLDIEYVRETREKVARRFFTKEEYAETINREGIGRDSFFFRVWTGKEAVVKAAGVGFKVSPDGFCILPGRVSLLGKSYRLSGKSIELQGRELWVSIAQEEGL